GGTATEGGRRRHRLDDRGDRPGAHDEHPGLALFYCGMVRKKNVLATMAQTLLCVMLGSILWAVVGYSLAFSGDNAIIGNFDRLMLKGIGMTTVWPQTSIPEMLFMIYQMTFAVITVALVAGSVA